MPQHDIKHNNIAAAITGWGRNAMAGFLVILVQLLSAQTYINTEWVQSTGQPDNIHWTVSTLDPFGDLLVVGNTQVAPGVTQVLITKYDSRGDLIWQESYAGTQAANDYGVAVTTNATGDVFVAATVSNTGNDLDFALLKYDVMGDLQWDTSWDGPTGLADVPMAITLDSLGNVYLCGATWTNPLFTDLALVKFDPNGDIEWYTTYDHAGLIDAAVALELDQYGHPIVMGISASSALAWDVIALHYHGVTGAGLDTIRVAQPDLGLQNATAMAMDQAGNIYVTGSFHNGVDMDIQTLKIGTNFEMVWLENFDGNGNGYNDEGTTVAADDQGNVYVGGYIGNGSGGTEFITLKYDPTGELLWRNSYQPRDGSWRASATKLAISDSGVVVTGTVYTTAGMTFATVKYDGDGKLVWSQNYKSAQDDDKAMALALGANGIIYVTGISESATGNGYTTVKYDVHTRRNDAVLDSLGNPVYVENEIIVKFRPHFVDTTIIDDAGWQHGTLDQLLPDSLIASIEVALGLQQGKASRIKAYKVFRWLSRADSISISRLGQPVRIPRYWSTFVIEPDSEQFEAIVDSLATLTEVVEYAHVNSIFEKYSNDPIYVAGNQSSLAPTTTYPNAHINIEPAWAIQTGRPDIKVGIIDGVINWDHEDFNLNGTTKVIGVYNLIDGSPYFLNTQEDNPYGTGDYHGTSCASIIGAVRNNGIGVAGIAGGDADDDDNSGCSLYSLMVGHNLAYTTMEIVANAILFGSSEMSGATVGFGCHVLNISMGYQYNNQNMPNETSIQMLRTCHANGCVLVGAVGNHAAPGENFASWPTAHSDADEFSLVSDHAIISVGATGYDGTYLTPINGDMYANYGPQIDLVAPGAKCNIAVALGGTGVIPCNGCEPGNGYHCFQGTSSAAPHVAGVAALMVSEHSVVNGAPNNLAPEDVEQILEEQATYLQHPTNPWDPGELYTGKGRLNAGASVQSVSAPYCVLHSGMHETPIGTQQFAPQTIVVPYMNAWGLIPGSYNAYRVEVTHTYYHELEPAAQVVGHWGRASSTIGTHSTSLNGSSWASYTFNVTGNIVEVTAVTNCWFIENVDIDGVLSSEFFPAPPNSLRTAYSLHVLDGNCWGPSTVSVEEADMEPGFTVHPNPTLNTLYIGLGDLIDKDWQLDIIDLTGRVLITRTELGAGPRDVVIDTGHLARGTYCTRLSRPDRSHVRRFIKL